MAGLRALRRPVGQWGMLGAGTLLRGEACGWALCQSPDAGPRMRPHTCAPREPAPRGPLPRKGRPCGVMAAEAPGQEGKTKLGPVPSASQGSEGALDRLPPGWSGMFEVGIQGLCWLGELGAAGRAP